MSPVKARTLDFSNVRESSGISPKHVEEGDYTARCVGVAETKSKKDGTLMWVFTFTPDDYKSAVYPEYVKLDESSLWKLRNIFIAAGLGKLVSGKKATKVDPNLVVGKRIGISLVDDEYEGKMKSTIEAFIPISELEDGDDPETDTGVDAEVEDDEDEDEEEEVPVVKKAKKKAAPVVEEEDDDEEEEEEEEEPAPKPVSKRTAARRAKKAAVVEEEDDEDDEEEEPAPAPKKRGRPKKVVPVVEDEDDDLDIDLGDDDDED